MLAVRLKKQLRGHFVLYGLSKSWEKGWHFFTIKTKSNIISNITANLNPWLLGVKDIFHGE
jgi:hypothetical protein